MNNEITLRIWDDYWKIHLIYHHLEVLPKYHHTSRFVAVSHQKPP